MRFQATVFVRPGYGQPGGPTSAPPPKRDGRLAARRTQLPLRPAWADQEVHPTMSTLP